jgi:hypothetical protein
LVLLFFVGCTLGKQGVFLGEMQTSPLIKISKNVLTIKIANSIKNSALLIYQVEISVEQEKKEVFISANQAANKDYKEIFTFGLAEYKIEEPKAYSFYWLDPDKKRTNLEIIVQ